MSSIARRKLTELETKIKDLKLQLEVSRGEAQRQYDANVDLIAKQGEAIFLQWSEKDNEFVATWAAYPGLSGLGATRSLAVTCLLEAVSIVEEDQAATAAEP